MKVRIQISVFLFLTVALLESSGYGQQQRDEKLYIISTGECDHLRLNSAAGYSKDTGSYEVARVTAGNVGSVLEVLEISKSKWYKIRLEDGKEGWITESCTSTQLQIGGLDLRVFFILITDAGEKINGYLKRVRIQSSIRGNDFSIVNTNEDIEFEDVKLGKIKVRWQDIRSIAINGVITIHTIGGRQYTSRVGYQIGVKKESWTAYDPLTQRDYTKTAETSLWFVSKEGEVKIEEQKGVKFERSTKP